MSKARIKKESTYVDMTAMTDVAFLLLTFFMLTAKARPQEAVAVDMPSSISETKLPDANTITVLVAPDGKAYLDFAGTHTRAKIAEMINQQFSLGFSPEDIVRFQGLTSFGVPIKDLKKYLRTEPSQRKDIVVPGIPKDTTLNELGTWIHTARVAQFELKNQGVVDSEYVVVVKGDANTPYPAIEEVIHTLTDINVNKFNLITNMEGDPNKLEAIGKKK